MQREKCPLCEGEAIAAPASIVPFMQVRCQLDQAETTRRYCAACDFAFFQRGLTAEEAQRLYVGYRDQTYTAERLAVEPSYSRFLEDFQSRESLHYTQRLDSYAAFLAVQAPEVIATAKRALDFGGDGYFVRKLVPQAEAEVLDLSTSMVPVEGPLDFIFVSNVLEHLSEPVVHGRKLRAMLADGGMLFADVPLEYTPPLADAFATADPATHPLARMHEHINYFSPRALESWAAQCGLKPVAAYEGTATSWRLIGVLCTPDVTGASVMGASHTSD